MWGMCTCGRCTCDAMSCAMCEMPPAAARTVGKDLFRGPSAGVPSAFSFLLPSDDSSRDSRLCDSRLGRRPPSSSDVSPPLPPLPPGPPRESAEQLKGDARAATASGSSSSSSSPKLTQAEVRAWPQRP